jgi:hypothetical protein
MASDDQPQTPQPPQPTAKGNKTLVAVFVAALLVLVIFVGWWFFIR